jgi:nicotinamide mononucleotide transporter
MSTAEWLAVALGLAYLILAVRQQRACWLAGGMSAALFTLIFYDAHLTMQAGLQLYYVAVAVHGWMHWGRRGSASELPVRRWMPRQHLLLLTAIGAVAGVALMLRGAPGDLVTTLDAVTTTGSVAATWLVARKVLENWWYWVAIDLASVIMYWQSQLPVTAGLYLLYTVIAVYGWFQWRIPRPATAP